MSIPVILSGAGYEVCVKMDLSVKIAAFCRELGDSTLSGMAFQEGMEPEYRHARETLEAGRIGPELEAGIDALDAMVRKVAKRGLYPSAIRT